MFMVTLYPQSFAQIQSGQPSGNIEELLKSAQEKVASVEKMCIDFFNRFDPPATGYARYTDNFNCFSIDYPALWSIDNNTLDNQVIITDRDSTVVTISLRGLFGNTTQAITSLQDVKNAIASHDTSIPTLASIPNLYDFESSPISDGFYLDNQPSIKSESVSDLSSMTVKKNLFATLSGLDLYVIVTQMNEKADPLVLQHMIDSVHIR